MCVLPCFIIDGVGAATCNLTVVNKTRCTYRDCPTTGCRAFEFCQDLDPNDSDVCMDKGGFSNPTAVPRRTSTATTAFPSVSWYGR